MSITLYFNHFTRSTRVRWMLEELGVPYNLVPVDLMSGAHKHPDYLKVHPLGKVPALVHDGRTLIESVAICQYLAHAFPEQNLGAGAPGSAEAGDYFMWTIYAQVTLEPHLVAHFGELRKPEEARNAGVLADSRARFLADAAPLAAHLADHTWVCGDRFSAADVLVGSIFGWAKGMGLIGELPAVVAYMDRVGARPGYRKGRQPA